MKAPALGSAQWPSSRCAFRKGHAWIKHAHVELLAFSVSHLSTAIDFRGAPGQRCRAALWKGEPNQSHVRSEHHEAHLCGFGYRFRAAVRTKLGENGSDVKLRSVK